MRGRGCSQNSKTPPEFDPPCDEDPEAWKTESGLCSGRFPVNVSLVDWLAVPLDTPPGEWVLQFRYDCEETAQVRMGRPRRSFSAHVCLTLAFACRCGHSART